MRTTSSAELMLNSSTPGIGASHASSKTTHQATRVLLARGAIAGPFYVVVGLIEAFIRDGFDIRRHMLSLLSNGDLRWIQIANFLIAGILTVAFATGMRRVWPDGRGGVWGPLSIGIYGLGLSSQQPGSSRPSTLER